MACSLKPGAALMDLANLNAFIAIAETGSFSEAGERLHLTQPAAVSYTHLDVYKRQSPHSAGLPARMMPAFSKATDSRVSPSQSA